MEERIRPEGVRESLAKETFDDLLQRGYFFIQSKFLVDLTWLFWAGRPVGEDEGS